MREIGSDLRRWLDSGERFALATVVETRKSAPRPVGASLGVAASGEMAGSVSGGCVESEVYAVARDVLAGAPPHVRTYGIADEQALAIGLPCGGEIDVFVRAADPRVVRRALDAIERGEPVAVRTRLADGAAEITSAAGVRTGLADASLVEVWTAPPRLLVIGAVDLAEELCRAAKALGWRTVVADPRAQFATPARVPTADELRVEWPENAIADARPDEQTAIVVLTHEDRIDVPALVASLASDAFYVGALGSRRTQERRRERLAAAGVDEDALSRLAGPAGLDVGAQSPAETAVSILAEILAVREGRDGGRLRDRAGPIHAGV